MRVLALQFSVSVGNPLAVQVDPLLVDLTTVDGPSLVTDRNIQRLLELLGSKAISYGGGACIERRLPAPPRLDVIAVEYEAGSASAV
jgi:hypothetical protein